VLRDAQAYKPWKSDVYYIFYKPADLRFIVLGVDTDGAARNLEANPNSLIGTYDHNTKIADVVEDMQAQLQHEPLLSAQVEEIAKQFIEMEATA